MNVHVSPHQIGTNASIERIVQRSIPDGITRFEVTDRQSWLALRGADVTASVAAALVGEHPYMTRLGLYALKTGAAPDTDVEPKVTEYSISLPPMIRGTVLEPVVPVMIGMMRPTWQVAQCRWYYREPAARIGATPDFFVIDPKRKGFGVIQVKTTDERTYKSVWRRDEVEEDLEDEGPLAVPLFIAIQTIIEATQTGASYAYVGLMVSDKTLDLHLVPVPIHAGIMSRLRTLSLEFWELVQRGEPPQADYGRDAEILAALYREDNGQELDLRADNLLPALVEERDGHVAEIRTRKDRVGEIDNILKERMGFFETMLLAGRRRITWRNETRKARWTFDRIVRVFRVK